MKQLFLYLTAEYETPNNKLNQVSLVEVLLTITNPARLARVATVPGVAPRASCARAAGRVVWHCPMQCWSCKLRTNQIILKIF